MQTFRSAAVKGREARLHGDVLLPSSLRTWSLALLATAFLAGVIAALAMIDYSHAYEVPGQVVLEGGVVEIASPVEAVVSDIHVAEGDDVETGVALVTLLYETAITSRPVGVAGGLIDLELSYLKAQIDSIKAKRDVLDDSYAAKRAQIGTDVGAASASISRARQALELVDGRLTNARSLLTAHQDLLTDGASSQLEVNRQQDVIFLLEQERLSVIETIDNAANAILQHETTLNSLVASERLEQASYDEELARLRNERVRLERERGGTLRAPRSGRVAAVTPVIGDVVPAGAIQVIVAPSGSELIAELAVPSNVIGIVERGQRVRLRVHGTKEFDEKMLPSTVFSVAEAPTQIWVPESVPSYRVLVRFDREDVSMIASEHSLQLGMNVTAEIGYEKKGLIQALLP